MVDLAGQIFGGRYRVEAFVGHGGMADVYKVWDQHRAVFLAMKVLRADLSKDESFLRRFEREAQTLEKLQHPSIVRFYGLEKSGNLAYILMDFIDGMSLRKEILIYKEGLPNKRILEVMQPVCAALYYAHQMGMVHCDIKSDNILVQRNQAVYLADFGITRMTETSVQSAIEPRSGTLAYMSPEQLLGQEPTPASDIYSLGIVLYEMATGGQRPFNGEMAKTSGTVAQKIIWEKQNLPAPAPHLMKPEIHPELEMIILRCLERDPQRRYHSALDLLGALQVILNKGNSNDETLTQVFEDDENEETINPSTDEDQGVFENLVIEAQTPTVRKPFWRRPFWIVAGLAAVALAVAGLMGLFDKVKAPVPTFPPERVSGAGMLVSKSTVSPVPSPSLPPALTLTEPAPVPVPTHTILPQPTAIGGGGQIAFASDRGGSVQVWVMDASQPDHRQQITDIPGGACQPAWSPDGTQLAFTTPCIGPSVYFSAATIKIIRLADMVITDLPLKTGAGSFDPAWSPDGKTLLYTVIIGKDTEIRSIHLPDNKITTLANRGTKNAQPAWSRDGEYIAFISSDDIHNDALWLMRKNGDSQEILSSAGAFSEPAWAPDGIHILVSLNKGNNIPILAWFDRSNPTQPEVALLPDVYRMSYGSISPDGQWLIFWSDHIKNNPELFLITRDGKTSRQITNNLLRDFQPAWSSQ